MAPSGTLRAVLALVLFTALSSLLGLSGQMILFDPVGAFQFAIGIWTHSVLADLAFTAGSMTAAGLLYLLARGGSVVPAVLVGGAAHWIVYLVSYLLLPMDVRMEGTTDLVDALSFVGTWGWVGLTFAAIAPPALGWWDERKARRAEHQGEDVAGA